MAMMYAEPLALGDETDVEALSCVFRGLADPTRMAILAELATGERTVAELTQHVGLAQSTVSKHLACLRDCGLVESRAQGRSSIHSLSHADAVVRLFAAAEELLALTGDAVVLCPVYGDSGAGR